jgi:hypothetical protein
LLAIGADLDAMWNAPTTSPRDWKELLRTLLEATGNQPIVGIKCG